MDFSHSLISVALLGTPSAVRDAVGDAFAAMTSSQMLSQMLRLPQTLQPVGRSIGISGLRYAACELAMLSPKLDRDHQSAPSTSGSHPVDAPLRQKTYHQGNSPADTRALTAFRLSAGPMQSTMQEHGSYHASALHGMGTCMVQGGLLATPFTAFERLLMHPSSHLELFANQQTSTCHAAEQPGPLSATPMEAPSASQDEVQSPPGQQQQSPIVCKNRGTTYQPSRRKRVNKHGLAKRCVLKGHAQPSRCASACAVPGLVACSHSSVSKRTQA
jgi:hypothetical protein